MPGVSQKFCNIWINGTLWCVYRMTEAVQDMEDTHFGC